MSYDDKFFKRTHYVRHKYGRGKQRRRCVRCGVRRRYRFGDWEYKGRSGNWMINNPPCVEKGTMQ